MHAAFDSPQVKLHHKGAGAFLIMEDGVPLRPVGACNVNELFEVNLEQAAAVEVIRGPGLGPQGANALHGQVNVRSVALDAPTRLALEAGSFAYSRLKLQGSVDGYDVPGRLAFALHDTRDQGWRDDTGFRERLGVILQSLYEDAGLTRGGRITILQNAIRVMANRLRIEELVKRHPEILDIHIDRPVFIAGLPRSGTTHLVNWLSPMKERVTIITGDRGAFVADTITADLTFHANGTVATEWSVIAEFRGVSEGDMIRYAFPKPEP